MAQGGRHASARHRAGGLRGLLTDAHGDREDGGGIDELVVGHAQREPGSHEEQEDPDDDREGSDVHEVEDRVCADRDERDGPDPDEDCADRCGGARQRGDGDRGDEGHPDGDDGGDLEGVHARAGYEADGAVSGERGHQEEHRRPRAHEAGGEEGNEGPRAAQEGAQDPQPDGDAGEDDRPHRAVLGVLEPPEGRVRDEGHETQRGDRADEEEADADEGEDRGEPLVLVAGRGLVGLLGGEDAAGQGDGGPGGKLPAEDGRAVEGASVRMGEADRRDGQVDGQHGTQSGDRGPLGGGEIGGAILVDYGHGHHGCAHRTSDLRETTVPSVVHRG